MSKDEEITDQYTRLITHVCNASDIQEQFSRSCEQFEKFMDVFLDKEGNPISREQFRLLCEDFEYKCIGRDQIGPWLISTVWRGLLSIASNDLFETMVFHDNDEWNDQNYPVGYETLEEAIKGHKKVVNEYELKVN